MKYDQTTREIFLYDSIGKSADGYFGADIVASALSKMGSGPITIRINSPGGSLYEAWAMHELIERHKQRYNSRFMTSNDGLCASSATILLLTGDHIVGSKQSIVMVHKPWIVCVGNEDDLRRDADTLTLAGERLCQFYAAKLKVTRGQLDQWLRTDSYFDSDQSLLYGFYHQITGASSSKSVAPEREKAEAKLRQYRAQDLVHAARRNMEDYYQAKGQISSATKIIDAAPSKSNFPRLNAARLALLKRNIKERARSAPGPTPTPYRWW